MAILKPSMKTMRDVASMAFPEITPEIRDSMAIPSFLHGNPFVRLLVWQRYEVISRLGGFERGETVLEFGCGPGFFLPELNARGCRILALDLYPQYARALCNLMNIHAGFPGKTQDIPDGTVDVIVAAQVMEHIESPGAYYAEFLRILTPRGTLVVSLPTENLLYKVGRIAAGFMGKGDYHVSGIGAALEPAERNSFQRRALVSIPSPFFPLYKVFEFRKTEER